MADVLSRAHAFTPAEELAGAFGPNGAELVGHLREGGWLWSMGELRAALRVVPARPARPVEWIAVPTRGPSAYLDRLLAALGDAPVRVYVDDPDPAAADSLRGRGVEVVGPVERARWVAALADATGLRSLPGVLHPPAEHRWRVGALRNLILLHGAGRAVLSMDDDVVPRMVDTGSGSRLGSPPDPTVPWRQASREACWAGERAVDPRAVHGAIVGRDAASLVCDGDLSGGTQDLRDQVLAGATVVVSTVGIAGDNGSGRGIPVIMLRNGPLQHLLADYPARLEARAGVRGAPALTVTGSPWFMAPCFAFDGSALLPPTAPLHQNTDGLWGIFLRAVRPGLIAHLPLAVHHDPGQPRRFTRADFARTAPRYMFADLVAQHVAATEITGHDPADRLAGLAAALRLLAASASGLRERTQDLWRQWGADLLALITEAHEAGDLPAWREDLQQASLAVVDALKRPATVAEYDRDGVLDVLALRTDILGLADLVDAWPALMAAARELGPTV